MSNHKCEYCRHYGTSLWISSDTDVDDWFERPNHDLFCPKYPGCVDRIHREKLYKKGSRDGWQGFEPKSDDRTYNMGWGNGYCAREERDNGFDPVWMSE